MGQISIGNNATAITGHGGQERAFAYDGDVNHAAGAIAIGANTYARTGSIMIGSHVYKGNMGDVTGIDTDSFNTDSNGAYGFTVNSTTIGTNSFTRGNLATTIGDYNIQSGKSRGYGWNSLLYGAQNFGATVIGALNSNESQSAGSGMSGIANSIVGVANKVNSSNGTLVFGAGNEVTNSLTGIYGVDDTTSLRDATAAQNALKNAVAESDAGGAVLAIGGANKADWAQKSQLIGVGNTLIGKSSAVSEYNMINGYKNEVTNATHTSIIGSNNKAKDTKSTTVTGDNNDVTGSGNHIIGDNHKVTGANNIIVGNNKEQKTHTGHDSVIIGNNASAGTDSLVMGNQAHAGNTGIALGMNASAGDGQNLAIGYYANVSGAKNSTALGYASKVEKRDILSSDGNDGVVSVGKSVGQSGEAGITRRIINVKAGVNDTDAVNVSQLKGVETIANKGWNLTTGVVTDATQVKPGDTVDFSGDKNISVSHKGTDVSIALQDTLKLGNNATDDYVTVDGVKGTVWAGHAVSAGNVNMDGDSGEITGLTNTTLNSKDFATTGRAATEEQLKLVKNQADSAATEASKHSKVVNGSNITVEETDQDGQKTYKVGLNKNLEGIESISSGDAKINLNDTGVVISKGKDKTFSITDTGMGMSVIGDDYVTRSIMVGKNGTVISGGLSVAGSKITNVAAGSEDTDAVNVGQLKEAVEAGNTDTHIKAGEYGVGTDNKVNMQLVDKNGKDAGTVTITDVAKASDVGDVNNIASDIKNQDGKTTVVDAVNNLNNKVGDLQYSKVEKGEIADGDSTTTAIGKLDQKLTDVAATAAKHTKVEGSSNITVTNTAKEGEAANYKVELKKDIEVNTVNANSVTTGQTVMNKDGLKVGEKVSVTENGLKVGDKVSVTENAVTAGQTSISDAGVKVGENTYISDKGLNANSNKITNVADGEENSDAVNYGQLKKSETTINNRIDGVENQVISNSNRINQLGDRVNKVGAGAAALAALHPLDFDPDDKWDFAAGYGNYNGENAAAIGAYYRPNEDTMLSVGGSFGNGENMVNAGVSLKLGQGNHVSTSKVAMAKEIKDLRKEMEGLKSALLDANAGKKLDTSKLQLFPDVPKNHWAYEYVSTLKGNGALTGYPDGEFKGDRPMTRYEFATMLYKAMLEGATLSDRILEEFAPELERFTVDTVHQDKDGKPTVERVRTVKAEK